jgi:hypothetical protein
LKISLPILFRRWQKGSWKKSTVIKKSKPNGGFLTKEKRKIRRVNMKKAFSFTGLISLILIIGLAVTSCSVGGSPSSVVKQLHTAIEKGDSKKVGELMTSEGAQLMIMYGDKAKGLLAAKGKITKTAEEIYGDDATVTVEYANGEEEEFELVKINGKWKVTMDK